MRPVSENREGDSGPLRNIVGRASWVTRPSWHETPTQWQCEVDVFHPEERKCGFSSELLNERRAFLSGFCSFWSEMAMRNSCNTKRVKTRSLTAIAASLRFLERKLVSEREKKKMAKVI